MNLTSRARGWWGATHALSIDGQPWGQFKPRFWGQGFAITIGGHEWALTVHGWPRPTYELIDHEQRSVARAQRAGFWRSHWQVDLSIGPCVLRSRGWLGRRYELTQDGTVGAEITSLGMWRGGWVVTAHDPALSPADLLLLLLVRQKVNQHAQQAAG